MSSSETARLCLLVRQQQSNQLDAKVASTFIDPIPTPPSIERILVVAHGVWNLIPPGRQSRKVNIDLRIFRIGFPQSK